MYLTISSSLRVEPLGSNGVDLIDEDDGRRVLAGQAEDISYHTRALPQVLLHKLRAYHTNEGCSCMMSHCLGYHGLTSARRSIEEYTARRVDTDLRVELVVSQG